MTVNEASTRICPFTDTKPLHGHDASYCVMSNCMAWVYTNEYKKEQCMSAQMLPEPEKEGYCSLTRKEM